MLNVTVIVLLGEFVEFRLRRNEMSFSNTVHIL